MNDTKKLEAASVETTETEESLFDLLFPISLFACLVAFLWIIYASWHFSEPEVNQKLWDDYHVPLKEAGITKISPQSFFSSTIQIDIDKGGESYSAYIKYNRRYYMPKVTIEVKSDHLEYEAVKDEVSRTINYSEYDEHYELGSKVINSALEAAKEAEENRLKWNL